MGHRTLSLNLIWRAMLLQPGAYDQMRDDDNPFMEGALLVLLIGVLTAVMALLGQVFAYASSPRLLDVKSVVVANLLPYLQAQPWWQELASDPARLATVQGLFDQGWRILPVLLGAPDPAMSALRIVAWPIMALASWLIYGGLTFVFARLLRGTGTLNQTLGVTALAAAPLLLRGLGVVPYLVIGSFLTIWQLLCRYVAIQSVHRLSWGRALLATLLPIAVYLLFWLAVIVAGWVFLGASLGR